MRFRIKEKQYPEIGSTRTRTVFAWWPMKGVVSLDPKRVELTAVETRWLEKVTITETYRMDVEPHRVRIGWFRNARFVD